jgi:hypothetical protein
LPRTFRRHLRRCCCFLQCQDRLDRPVITIITANIANSSSSSSTAVTTNAATITASSATAAASYQHSSTATSSVVVIIHDSYNSSSKRRILIIFILITIFAVADRGFQVFVLLLVFLFLLLLPKPLLLLLLFLLLVLLPRQQHPLSPALFLCSPLPLLFGRRFVGHFRRCRRHRRCFCCFSFCHSKRPLHFRLRCCVCRCLCRCNLFQGLLLLPQRPFVPSPLVQQVKQRQAHVTTSVTKSKYSSAAGTPHFLLLEDGRLMTQFVCRRGQRTTSTPTATWRR